MTDTKISALTNATTPLDGTEVLPIVQSGTTKKVANNDLRPKQIQSKATSGVLQIYGPAAASTRVMTTPDADFTVARIDAAQTFSGVQSFSDTTGFQWGGGGTAFTAAQVIGTLGTGGSLAILTPSPSASFGSAIAFGGSYDAGTYTSTLCIYAAGVRSGGPYNAQLDIQTSLGTTLSSKWRFTGAGNFVQLNAGKGVDFTANTGAAGKTSQLLNWYEEGAFTPTVGGTWVANPTSLDGKYTRIGRTVYITLTFTGGTKASATSGWIDSLPFNISVSGTGAVVDSNIGNFGLALAANTTRVWLTANAFGAGTNYVSVVYMV